MIFKIGVLLCAVKLRELVLSILHAPQNHYSAHSMYLRRIDAAQT